MKKIVSIISIVVLLILLGFLLYYNVFQKTKEKKPAQTVQVVDKIEQYGYSLDDNETSYYQSLFQELKKLTDQEKIDDKEFATLVGQMFLTDFYNLENKITKNDIGGTQFVYGPYRIDFEKYAQESIYHSIENNLYGDRKQELPIVVKVTAKDISEKSFAYGDTKDSKALVIEYQIEYQKDLGYETNPVLIFIHHDNKLEIAKMEGTE